MNEIHQNTIGELVQEYITLHGLNEDNTQFILSLKRVPRQIVKVVTTTSEDVLSLHAWKSFSVYCKNRRINLPPGTEQALRGVNAEQQWINLTIGQFISYYVCQEDLERASNIGIVVVRIIDQSLATLGLQRTA